MLILARQQSLLRLPVAFCHNQLMNCTLEESYLQFPNLSAILLSDDIYHSHPSVSPPSPYNPSQSDKRNPHHAPTHHSAHRVLFIHTETNSCSNAGMPECGECRK